MTHKRIVTDPTIVDESPIIRGTDVLVHEVLTHVASTVSEEILDRFSNLELADVKAAIEYATNLVRQQARLPDEEQVLDEAAYNRASPVDLDIKKILVVDDSAINRSLIQHMFKGSDFSLSMASDGEEALAKARIELPILVISDIQMPGMSGFELLKALKTDERTKNIAVILVTAHQRASKHTSQGLDMGADDYIHRPFMRNEFMSRVGAVMRMKWAETKIRRQARTLAQYNKGLEVVNDLALAVNSSLDLQEIFASSMQKLSKLLDTEAVLLLLDEENQQLVANISSRTGKCVSIPCDFSFKEKVTDRVIQEQVPVIVSNILNDHQLDLGTDFAFDVDMIQCISMISREQIIGAIAIVNKRKGAFDDADWVLLHSAAGIIAVAVENTHLLKGAQQQVDDLIALNEIGRALTSNLDLEQTLKLTTLVVQKSLQSEATSLWLLDETSQELELIASSGPGSDVVTGFHLSIYDGIAGHVIRTGEPHILTDVSKDEVYFESVANMSNYKLGSILSVPIQVKGRIIGVMQVFHRQVNWFDQNHLRLFNSVASSIGIAVENARLFSEIQDFNLHLERMVTERTRELAEEKEKTEAILTSMADGLLVLDAKNRILTANVVAEDMLDFHLSESLGESITPEQLKNPLWRCISELTNTAESTASASVDVPLPQTETQLSIQAISAKVRNEAGQVIGTVIVLRDITALKEVESMKARFMAGVTHELKTPLSIIQFYCDNLLTYHDRLSKQKMYELLNSVQNQVTLLRQLIENILQLSRLDGGMNDIEYQPLDLVELIDQVVVDLHPLAETKQITLDWQKPTMEVTAIANANQLDRVIRNLVDNAIKYTPVGGSVKVQTYSELINDHLSAKIRVMDTGIGIPLEHQSRIFERFYRVDSSHTIPGTGLGLAIIKEIVNAHSGKVQLDSIPGEGSTFIVELPVKNNINKL